MWSSINLPKLLTFVCCMYCITTIHAQTKNDTLKAFIGCGVGITYGDNDAYTTSSSIDTRLTHAISNNQSYTLNMQYGSYTQNTVLRIYGLTYQYAESWALNHTTDTNYMSDTRSFNAGHSLALFREKDRYFPIKKAFGAFVGLRVSASYQNQRNHTYTGTFDLINFNKFTQTETLSTTIGLNVSGSVGMYYRIHERFLVEAGITALNGSISYVHQLSGNVKNPTTKNSVNANINGNTNPGVSFGNINLGVKWFIR